MTFRSPITDARRFSSEPSVAASVVLPLAWTDKGFVRGLGKITRRPAGAVEPWSHESAFADLARTILFEGAPLELFNREFSDFTIHKIRKRAWMALPDTTALLDVDVALQMGPRANRRISFPGAGDFSLTEMARAIGKAAALPVRVRSDDASTPPVRLLVAGPRLATRYALHTSVVASSADQLVNAGQITVVVEAPGLTPNDAGNLKSEQLSVGGINLVSFDVTPDGGGAMRCHVIWDASGSKGNRKRIRELRIHILRLHSIYELMQRLASRTVASPTAHISDAVGTPGFDALQRTLLSCVRTVQSKQRPGGADAKAILDTAFFARNFSNRNLDVLLDRTISAMRPKVRNEIVAFRADEERRKAENAAAGHERDRNNATTINVNWIQNMTKFEINGDNNGIVGNNARVKNMNVGAAPSAVAIGDLELSREALLDELRTLGQNLAESGRQGASEAAEAVRSAENNLQEGKDGAATKSLQRAGEWAANAATTVGTGVASRAIAAALGLA